MADTPPPTPNHHHQPNPSRLCHYYTTDLCHLAADLHFGASSMQNVLTYTAKWRKNENEMIWASLLIHGLSPVLSSVSSPLPASFLSVSSFSILSSPLPPLLPPACHPWVISVLSHSTAHRDTLICLARRTCRHTHTRRHTRARAYTHTHWSGPQVKFNRNGQTAFLCQADCKELMLI